MLKCVTCTVLYFFGVLACDNQHYVKIVISFVVIDKYGILNLRKFLQFDF